MSWLHPFKEHRLVVIGSKGMLTFEDSSIEKNLSIVCFNANQWIGNGLTIPSGPLREGLSALKRANCVIINGEKNTSIENKILDKNKNIKIFYTKYIAENLKDFKNKKIVSFAGIGNPINFFNLLKNNQMNVVEQISYPDHYNYSKKDLETLVKKSASIGANATIVCGVVIGEYATGD